ncbi:unnamed protein product [Caenorhabditis bovis]|uniref:Serpentine receptor class gamma n=1 Tax=Caenorhabditis bovis TaxID=2654633 RepID=A0A8S1FF66_9PELO|nr:unnamed protein product [Caenorhabditis bovis]
MDYFLIVALQLAYIVPSLILYAFIFVYISRSRDPEFKSAFHRLFLVRAPADVTQVLISLTAFRFPLAGWEGCLKIPILAKIGFVVSQYSTLLELCALLILSANRLTAIALPITHNQIWSSKRILLIFLVCACTALVPTCVRIPQPAAYFNHSNHFVPYLLNATDQVQNSMVSSCIYTTFCICSLACNIWAISLHQKQRRLHLFETQPSLASTVQTNLLIYSCIFTCVLIAMTIFQCLLAVDAFPLRSDAHNIVILMLTICADALALSNPWLLLILSNSFRQKFMSSRKLSKIFAISSTTGETLG